jgi:hypothetical protein
MAEPGSYSPTCPLRDLYHLLTCWLAFFPLPALRPSLPSSAQFSSPPPTFCVPILTVPSLYHPLVFLCLSLTFTCVLPPRPPMACILITNIIPLFCVLIMVSCRCLDSRPTTTQVTHFALSRVVSPSFHCLVFIVWSIHSYYFYRYYSGHAATIHFSIIVE